MIDPIDNLGNHAHELGPLLWGQRLEEPMLHLHDHWSRTSEQLLTLIGQKKHSKPSVGVRCFSLNKASSLKTINHAGYCGRIERNVSRQRALINARLAGDGVQCCPLQRRQTERIDLQTELGNGDLVQPAKHVAGHLLQSVWERRRRGHGVSTGLFNCHQVYGSMSYFSP